MAHKTKLINVPHGRNLWLE